jgi:hypothetical protein
VLCCESMAWHRCWPVPLGGDDSKVSRKFKEPYWIRLAKFGPTSFIILRPLYREFLRTSPMVIGTLYPKKMTWLQQDSGNLGEAVRVLGLQRVGRHDYCCPSANHDGVTSGAPRLNTDSTDVGHLPVFNLTSTDPQQYKLALGIKMAWSKCTCGLITG